MKRIIVGMSGASGAIYGIRLLEALRAIDGIETHLVISPSASRTILEETDCKPDYARRCRAFTCRYRRSDRKRLFQNGRHDRRPLFHQIAVRRGSFLQ